MAGLQVLRTESFQAWFQLDSVTGWYQKDPVEEELIAS